MAGKQGRWAAGPGGGQPAGKLGAQGAATSGHGAPLQADTKRYPVVPPASAAEAKLPRKSQTVPVRGNVKLLGTNVEEETGTVELTSVEEITNVSAATTRSTRLARRLPLPAPRDPGEPGEDEDEYTDVQIAKSVPPPELLELSESSEAVESLELSESTELPESMTSMSTSIARGRGAQVQARGGRKPRSAPQEPTLTELDPVLHPSEVTRTISEATATIVTPSDVPRNVPIAPAARAEVPAAIEVVAARSATTPVDAERAKDLGASDSEIDLEGVTSHRRRYLVVPAAIVLVGLYLVVSSLLSGPTKKAASLTQNTTLDSTGVAREAPREIEPLPPLSETPDQGPGAKAEVLPTEQAQMVLEPEMVFEPEEMAQPQTEPVPSASEESGSVAAPALDKQRANRASARRQSARPGKTNKSEAPADRRENVSPGGKQVAQQFYKKGTSAFMGGKLAAAEREFQSALRADPGFALALRGLGLVYERQGQKSKAVGAFRRYLKRSPRAKDADKVNERIERLGG